MYLKHFGFDQKPFNITPNPEFMFLSGTHKEVFAHLLYGIQNHSGFIAVTGEVGTGKTTVLRTLFNQLDNDCYRLALIFNPSLSALELLQNINREFGIECHAQSLSDLQQALNNHLLEENRVGRTVVLVIDEAQNLSPDVLEQIRLLSNLETETDKLIQIVLVGQPELAIMLEKPELRQLRQRITVRYRLEQMGQEDGLRYILHRAEVAGQPRKDLFEPNALRVILKKTTGNPRLINILCDRSLLVAFSADASQVRRQHVEQALRELWREEGGTGLNRIFVFCCFLLLCFVGAAGWWMNRAEPPLQPTEPVVVAPPVISATVPESASTLASEPESPLADRMQVLRRQLSAQQSSQDLRNAFNAMAGLWQVKPLDADTPIQPGSLRNMARDRGLDLTTYSGSFASFLQFNLPAILDLSIPGVDSPRYLALTAFDSGGFRVSPEFPHGDRLQIDELESLWSGYAYLVWKNHADIPYIGKTGEQGQSVLLLQQLLARSGFYNQSPSGLFDQDTIAAVTRFQAASGLIQDGRIGPQTLILLYRAAGFSEIQLDQVAVGGGDMSSILKALRKLEEEKARQDQGSVDIATDILRTSGRRASRSWLMPLAVAALLLAGAGGGVYLSRSLVSDHAPETVIVPEMKTIPSRPVVVSSAPASATEPKIQSFPVSPPVEKTPVTGPPVISTPDPAPVAIQAQPVPLDRTQSIEDVPPEMPKLVVSGIVYQEDPQNRMAVINDLPVMSGTTIEGVDVVEIQPDRVIFSFEGQRFSILMSDQ